MEWYCSDHRHTYEITDTERKKIFMISKHAWYWLGPNTSSKMVVNGICNSHSALSYITNFQQCKGIWERWNIIVWSAILYVNRMEYSTFLTYRWIWEKWCILDIHDSRCTSNFVKRPTGPEQVSYHLPLPVAEARDPAYGEWRSKIRALSFYNWMVNSSIRLLIEWFLNFENVSWYFQQQ